MSRGTNTDFHIICERDDGNISRLPPVWHLTDDTDPLLKQCSASWMYGTEPNRGRHHFIRALVLQIFNMNSFRFRCKSYKITINVLCGQTFHSKCRVDKGLTEKGEAKYIIEGRSARAGLLRPIPYTFIHSIFGHYNVCLQIKILIIEQPQS
jgi:hypothetical protein